MVRTKCPLGSQDARDCASTASCVSFPSFAFFSPYRRRDACLSCAFSRECRLAARSLIDLE